MADLPGRYGSKHLWTFIEVLDCADVFGRAFAFLRECGAVASASSVRGRPSPPQDAEQLRRLMWEVDRDKARRVLVDVSSTTLAYWSKGRYWPDKADEVFGTVAELLGRQTRWWTNTNLTFWKPVTRQAMDALVIGVGSGVAVAVLAVDDPW